jgi:hypothetical protein
VKSEPLNLVPGTELLLASAHGIRLGVATIESVSGSGAVIARLSLDDVVPRPTELQLLMEIAEATDCLALAAMEELEVELAGLGFHLEISGQNASLRLRQDFSGVVITERNGRIAFRLTTPDWRSRASGPGDLG